MPSRIDTYTYSPNLIDRQNVKTYRVTLLHKCASCAFTINSAYSGKKSIKREIKKKI